MRSWIKSHSERSRKPCHFAEGGITRFQLNVELCRSRPRVHSAAHADWRGTKVKVQFGDRDDICVQIIADVVVSLDRISDLDPAHADVVELKLAD